MPPFQSAEELGPGSLSPPGAAGTPASGDASRSPNPQRLGLRDTIKMSIVQWTRTSGHSAARKSNGQNTGEDGGHSSDVEDGGEDTEAYRIHT